MAFIPVTDTARLEVVFTQQGQRVENVFHFQRDGGYADTALLEDLIERFVVAWDANISPLQATAVEGLVIKATDLSAENSVAIEVFNVLDGQRANPPPPNNVTFTIKWITGLAGRSFRGRTYHIGLTNDQLNGNDIIGAEAEDIKDAYNLFRAAMVATGHQMVVVSYVEDGAPRVAGLTTPITSALYADLHLDSQRRRLTGRGL